MAEERVRVLSAGNEGGAFTIWKSPTGDPQPWSMTGGTAEGSADDDARYFPRTRAPTLAALVERLMALPGWIPLPLFHPLTVDAKHADEIDEVFGARWPELWAERRARWLGR